METSTIPKWLSTLLTKKRNLIPISIPMEDMVNKCLGRTSKSKRLKTEAMIDVDDQTCHWVANVARPLIDKDVEKIDLGVTSWVVDAKHLETSTKRVLTRTWKDEKDKNKMKHIIMQMAQYINAIRILILNHFVKFLCHLIQDP